jgi:hypothetical protein
VSFGGPLERFEPRSVILALGEHEIGRFAGHFVDPLPIGRD